MQNNRKWECEILLVNIIIKLECLVHSDYICQVYGEAKQASQELPSAKGSIKSMVKNRLCHDQMLSRIWKF